MDDEETIGIQATSAANIQARVKKLKDLPSMRRWLRGKNRRLQVWGWGKYSVRRGGPKRWKLRIIELTFRLGKFQTTEDPEGFSLE
jgi:hypothetical protein